MTPSKDTVSEALKPSNPMAIADSSLEVQQNKGNAAAIRLLDEGMNDQSGYDDHVWPILEKALKDNSL